MVSAVFVVNSFVVSGALFYLFYFAAVGVYGPYWTLYLNHLKLAPFQIATLYSIPALSRIILPLFYGYAADRWQKRRLFLQLACFLQIIPLLFIIRFHSYPSLLILIFGFALFNSIVLPFAEATVQEEHEKGRLDYGRTRLWGSLSFILVAVSFGRLLDFYSDRWILFGFIGFQFLSFTVSLFIPPGKIEFPFLQTEVQSLFRQRKTWIFLICVFLMHLSHGTFYGFYSIFLESLGYPDSGIGIHWALAAASEIIIFFFGSRILTRFPQQSLFSFCMVAAAFRWFLTGQGETYWGLSLYQTLHAFSFGLFHIVCMRMVHELFPEGSRSFGQTLYSSISWGFGSLVGVLLSGFVWEMYGPATFYFSSAAAAVAFLISLFLVKPRRIRSARRGTGD